MQNLYIKIPDGANVVIDKLYENGHSAFVVGGCVRDFILEKEPHDWDICTDTLPEQVMQIFGEKNVIPTGIKHGTVTVLIGNDNYEVTTYRIDGMYSDGRRPDNVEFTQNLIEDLSRRDFSINAMAYNDKIGLIDPFGGISDIKNRRICCVGDPGKRFGEDYLRILRAIRFSSTFGFIIDKHTRMVAAINAPNLRMLANERVGAEIRKILCGRYAADVIDENKTSIAWVIPEIIDMVGCEQNNPYHVEDVFQHTLSAMRNMSTSNIFPAEWVDDYVRCALFFHDIGKPKSKSTDENGCDHFNGSKTMEILKSSCWNLKAPFFVLCCNDEDDKIIGSFICNKIDDLYCPVELPNISSLEQLPYHTKQWLVQSGLTYYQLCAMAKRRQRLYGWLVSSPVALDLPLTVIGEEYPPQAWKYLSLTGIQAQLALAGAYAP